MADAKPKADLGQKQVQQGVDEAQSKGYFGVRADAFPLDAYSIKSGPESPSVVEEHAAALEQRVKEVKASNE